MNVFDLMARGVQWGDVNDTRFLKITGTCDNTDGHQALFDIQVARVNSTGTFTELFVKMSKMNGDKTMYEPYEVKIRIPEVAMPDATWGDVW